MQRLTEGSWVCRGGPPRACRLWIVYLTAPACTAARYGTSQTTLKRAFVATIMPEGGEPSVGPLGSWTLELRHPNGKPVRGAKITVDGGMPEHNHGLPTAPTVSADLGDGRYRVEGVKFSMPGRWVLKFKITAAEGTTRLCSTSCFEIG